METNILSFFKEMDAFQNIPASELGQLAAKSRLLKVQKSETIFQEGANADACWWVASGIVKISKLNPDGRMLTMEMLTQGDIFAPAGIMHLQFYPANAIAVTSATVIKILKADMSHFVQNFPKIVQNVLDQISQRLQRSHRLRALDSSSSEKKVAAALLWLSEKTGSTVGVSRKEISEIAGVAPETAIRILLKFKRKQWVKTTARTVLPFQSSALQSFIEQE